jgi:hypothetical protein
MFILDRVRKERSKPVVSPGSLTNGFLSMFVDLKIEREELVVYWLFQFCYHLEYSVSHLRQSRAEIVLGWDSHPT